MERFNKKQEISLMIMLVIILLFLILLGYKLMNNSKNITDDENDIVDIQEETINNDLYNYSINNRSTDYQKQLFTELEITITEDIIDMEKYATTLTKLFISDLFTLDNKKGSSDITSSQYVYDSYQDNFELMVKDTIYDNIELNIDKTRKQKLPVVKNVIVNSINRDVFLLDDTVIDNEAFYIDITIQYEEDLGYSTIYKVVLVNNDNVLQVVKLSE